jgi:phage gp36-like protein
MPTDPNIYATEDMLAGRIPSVTLTEALDDNGDGMADDGVLAMILSNASRAVDGYLSGLYTVPFDSPTAVVKQATLSFVLEALYIRRQQEPPKIIAEEAKFYRERLQRIGNRELPLDAATAKAFTPGAAIVSDMKVNAQST